MNQRHTNLWKRIRQYSAWAVPLISGAELSNAQVMYQDIDPDVNLAVGDSYSLDLNNDGSVDFRFKVTTYGTGWYFAGLVPYPPYGTNPNGFAGYTMTFGGDPSIYGFPSMFDSGQPVDGNLPWLAMQDLIWTSGGNESYFYAGMVSNYYGTIFGQWSGASGKFLALRFSPDGSALHHAWVRCDVNEEGSALTLKDFAYEATAGATIVTGDITGITDAASDLFRIISFEGRVTISCTAGSAQDARVRITNVLGQTLMEEPLHASVASYDLNVYGKGIYLVSVWHGSEVVSKKISFR